MQVSGTVYVCLFCMSFWLVCWFLILGFLLLLHYLCRLYWLLNIDTGSITNLQ